MSRLDIIELKLDFLTHQLLHFIRCFDTKRCECEKCEKFAESHQLSGFNGVGTNGHSAEPLKSAHRLNNTSASGLRKSSCASETHTKVPKVVVRKSSDHIPAKNGSTHVSPPLLPGTNGHPDALDELLTLRKEAAFTALLKTAAVKLEEGDYTNGLTTEVATEHSGSGCSSITHTDENVEDSLNMEPPKLKQRRKASMPVKIALMPPGGSVVKSPSESDLSTSVNWDSSAAQNPNHRSDSVGTLMLGLKRKCSDELDNTSQSSFSTEELSEQLLTGFDANTTPQSSDMKSCHICGKLLHRGYLPNHIRAKHQNNQPAACNFCGKEFSFVSNLYRHLRKIHKATHHDNNALVGSNGAIGGAVANGGNGATSAGGVGADKSTGSDGDDDEMVDKNGAEEENYEDAESPSFEAVETSRVSPPVKLKLEPLEVGCPKLENVRKSGVVIANEMSQRLAGHPGFDMLGSFAADLVQAERAKLRNQGGDPTMRRVQKIMETLAPI